MDKKTSLLFATTILAAVWIIFIKGESYYNRLIVKNAEISELKTEANFSEQSNGSLNIPKNRSISKPVAVITYEQQQERPLMPMHESAGQIHSVE